MIRPLEPADAPVVHHLLSASIGEQRRLDDLLTTPALTHRRVLLDGEAIVGVLEYRVVVDEAELCEIAVDPAARRRGHGRRLLAHLFADVAARGAASLFLEARAGNTAARRLYEATGFTLIGTRRGYYPDGEDAVLYRRPVPGADDPPGGDP